MRTERKDATMSSIRPLLFHHSKCPHSHYTFLLQPTNKCPQGHITDTQKIRATSTVQSLVLESSLGPVRLTLDTHGSRKCIGTAFLQFLDSFLQVSELNDFSFKIPTITHCTVIHLLEKLVRGRLHRL